MPGATSSRFRTPVSRLIPAGTAKTESRGRPDGGFRITPLPGVRGGLIEGHLKTELVLDALNLAVHNRQPAAALVHHSDRGSISGVYSLAFVQCSGMNYERLATSSRTA